MTNEELVREYQHGNYDALEEICMTNQGLIYSIVHSFRSMYACESKTRESVISSEDLAQYGYIGLIRAAKDYRPERGASFATVASMYIRASIFRSVCSEGRAVRLPEYRIRQIASLKACRNKYLLEQGREPTQGEISENIGVSTEDVEMLLFDEMRVHIASLDKPMEENGEGETLADMIPESADRIYDIENSIQNDQLRAVLWHEVDALGADPAEILHRFYEDGEALTDICESMGMKYGKAVGIKERALDVLRRGKCGRILREFSQDYCRSDSIAYSGRKDATEKAAIMRMEAENRAMKKLETLSSFEAAGIRAKERARFYDAKITEGHMKQRETIMQLKE